MTRLIDADALINKYQSETTVDVFRYEVVEDLKNAPTVDAVPVEYILKQIVKLERSKGQSYHAICYRHLLEVWEMENERTEE